MHSGNQLIFHSEHRNCTFRKTCVRFRTAKNWTTGASTTSTSRAAAKEDIINAKSRLSTKNGEKKRLSATATTSSKASHFASRAAKKCGTCWKNQTRASLPKFQEIRYKNQKLSLNFRKNLENRQNQENRENHENRENQVNREKFKNQDKLKNRVKLKNREKFLDREKFQFRKNK